MSRAEWRIWVFGGGVALPSAQRDNTFLGLEIGADCWLIDCGAAPYRRLLQAGLAPLRLRGVVLTHAHADHIYGLPALLFQLSLAGYEGILDIYGLAGTLRVARQVVESFELGEHCARHRWHVVEAAEDSLTDLAFASRVRLRAGLVCHSRPALGVRIEGAGGRTAAYSGDTEPCAGVVALARGVSWLLHECTVDCPLAGHSAPEDVGRIAVEAAVAKVGIVHYDPEYGAAPPDLLERVRREGFRGEVRIMEHMDVVG